MGQSQTVADRRNTVRVLLASLVGTSVEFYDFYIYATATSLVFGPLFFPASSASAQLLSSYASFGLAFLARPLGGVLFGHFGDRVGRKSTLVASLMTSKLLRPGKFAACQARALCLEEERQHLRPGHHWVFELGDAGNGTCIIKSFEKKETFKGTTFDKGEKAVRAEIDRDSNRRPAR